MKRKWNIKRWNDCRTVECNNQIEWDISDKYCIHCAPGFMVVKRLRIWGKKNAVVKYISAKFEVVKLLFKDLKEIMR